MKKEVFINKNIQEKIEVELPFYYKHVFYDDNESSIIYGVITENEHIAIHETLNASETTYEFEFNKLYFLNVSSCSDYLTKKEYASTKEEFEKVKKEALDFINKHYEL